MSLRENFGGFSKLCLMPLRIFVILCIILQYEICGSENTIAEEKDVEKLDLSAPIEVVVQKLTSDSVSLSWKPPPLPQDPSVKLFSYTLLLTPLSVTRSGAEKEYTLPSAITFKQVTGLKEGIRYAVQLSAVYGDPKKIMSRKDHRVLSAPKFTVLIPTTLQRDVPVGDDGIPKGEPACNCSEYGMVACTRRPGFIECTCQPGYAGKWCEDCAPGNFLVGKECKVCPCTATTSSAKCVIDSSGQVRCAECLPGHRGSLCTSCTAGFHWIEDRCTALNCLSSSLCAEQRDIPGCEHCIFLEDRFPSPAQRSNSDRGLADGTLPLIAVIVTLGILLLVAGMATCYRYWAYRRHQPRAPFFNMELQDDKSETTTAHTHCQYQHLDTSANRSTNETQQDISCSSAVQNEGGRLSTEPSRRTYNTMNA